MALCSSFVGEFDVGVGTQPGLNGEVGLIAQNEAKKYAFSAAFDSILDTKEDLVLQYELRLHDQLVSFTMAAIFQSAHFLCRVGSNAVERI
jgi:hypothetical protein